MYHICGKRTKFITSQEKSIQTRVNVRKKLPNNL